MVNTTFRRAVGDSSFGDSDPRLLLMGNRQCVACTRTTDMFLCWDCCKTLRRRLETAVWVAKELEVTFARLDQVGSPDRFGRASERPLPFHILASEATWVLHNTLATWARDLCETRAIEYVPIGYVGRNTIGPLRRSERYVPAGYVESTAGVARWLAHYSVSIALSESAGEAFDEIDEAVKSAQRVIDRPPGRLYVGACGEVFNGIECTADIYVTMGTHEARCPVCGATHSVEERRSRLRDSVRGLLGTAAELARLLPWIMGSPITRKRITYYANRGMISRREHSGETVYQIGEVIDAHVQCEARRVAAA